MANFENEIAKYGEEIADYNIDHVEVFYVDAQNGWAALEYDEDGNPCDEANYSFLRKDAIRAARMMAGGIFPIEVYKKDGQLFKMLNAGNA